MGEGSAHVTGRQHATLWCKVLGRVVEGILVEANQAPPTPGVPGGWRVAECLDKDAGCFGKGCPFTTDGGELPFGEVGESVDLPLEALDPLAEPSFEGEWN